MNVLIAGGFWAIAKFMVLLCCTIVSMIKAIYFYIKTCKKWKRLTKTLYVMTMVPLFASSIITLGGVSNIIKGDWVIKVFSVVIFGGFMGGWLWFLLVLYELRRNRAKVANCYDVKDDVRLIAWLLLGLMLIFINLPPVL